MAVPDGEKAQTTAAESEGVSDAEKPPSPVAEGSVPPEELAQEHIKPDEIMPVSVSLVF